MSSAAYQVTISMDAGTVTDLHQSGYALFAFLAVRCSDLAGTPLVWWKTETYSETTVVSFSWEFEAWTAPWPPPQVVVPGFSLAAAPGDLLTATEEPSGIGTVSEGGLPGDVCFLNNTGTGFGCGISQPSGGVFAPVCLLPLYGVNAQVVVPLPKILLLFSTCPDPAGTQVAPMSGPAGPGLRVDMSASTAYSVGYDIDTGWSWGENTWGQAVAPFSDLVPLLVEFSPPLGMQALRLAAGAAPRPAPA